MADILIRDMEMPKNGATSKRGCSPDYNGGFCADYDVDCKVCWEQWEQEHKKKEDE